MKGKITKREKEVFLKGFFVGGGGFLMILPFRDWISATFSPWIQVIIGGALVIFALKKW